MTEGDPVTRAAFEEATWSATEARCASVIEPWRGRLPAFWPVLPSHSIVRRESLPRGRAVRAAWTRRGGRCYSLASASADSLLAHPLSSRRNVFRLEAEHVCLLGGVLRRPGC